MSPGILKLKRLFQKEDNLKEKEISEKETVLFVKTEVKRLEEILPEKVKIKKPNPQTHFQTLITKFDRNSDRAEQIGVSPESLKLNRSMLGGKCAKIKKFNRGGQIIK